MDRVKRLICLARKHLFFWVQTSIYIHESAIAAIKIGVLFLRKNQVFNPVHSQLNKEIRTRPELIEINNDHGLPRKYTFGNQRNHNFCDDAAIIIAMTQQQLLRQ